ncbi:MAG TPA: hypothetical protein VG891_09575 [Rhizomicrobium sp.]|nr:hypothetical protein [Rhizomicrobium sp.]
MRCGNLTVFALAATLLAGTATNALVQAQPEPEEKPLPHATPLPPPDSLKPGAPETDDESLNLPQDKPVTIGSLVVLCTGTGSSKDTVDWQSYPVRVEFSNAAAQFLSGMNVKLSDGSNTVAQFTCWAPWVLFKAPSGGNYKLTASLAGRADSPVKSATFAIPSSGQKRVVIAFPEIQANE